MAYYGELHPHMVYGISLWGACAGYKFTRIFILQKTALRIILQLGFRETCRDVFKELGILTLPSLYLYETAVFCFQKCIVNCCKGKMSMDMKPGIEKYIEMQVTD